MCHGGGLKGYIVHLGRGLGRGDRGDALGQEEEEGRGRVESGWSRSDLLLLFHQMASSSRFGFWTTTSSVFPKISLYKDKKKKSPLNQTFCSEQCNIPAAQHCFMETFPFLVKTLDLFALGLPQGFACSFWSLGSAGVRTQCPAGSLAGTIASHCPLSPAQQQTICSTFRCEVFRNQPG